MNVAVFKYLTISVLSAVFQSARNSFVERCCLVFRSLLGWYTFTTSKAGVDILHFRSVVSWKMISEVAMCQMSWNSLEVTAEICFGSCSWIVFEKHYPGMYSDLGFVPFPRLLNIFDTFGLEWMNQGKPHSLVNLVQCTFKVLNSNLVGGSLNLEGGLSPIWEFVWEWNQFRWLCGLSGLESRRN